MAKNLPANAGDVSSIPGWGRSLGGEDPWRRKWQPTPVFLPGKPHGQSSLVGYSAWGHKSQIRLTKQQQSFSDLREASLIGSTECLTMLISEP